MDVSEVKAGVRDASPLFLGILPFAVVAGVAAIETGLSPGQAVAMSVIVFAGASQLAALELLGETAPLAVVIATAVVINLRLMMYSASIAPYFRPFRRRVQLPLAYLLTDQAYALSVAAYTRDAVRDRKGYYLGVAASIWVVWQLGTVAGVLLGTGVPPELGLSFAVPLVFLALLVPAMKDRPTTAAGIVAGIVAILWAGMPFNLGLLVAAVVGIIAGLLVEIGANV